MKIVASLILVGFYLLCIKILSVGFGIPFYLMLVIPIGTMLVLALIVGAWIIIESELW